MLLLPWARSHPDDTEARLAAAFAAIRLERPRDAEELLSGLPQTDSRVRLAQGNLLLLENDADGAITALRPLVEGSEAQGSNALADDARRLLADAYLGAGKPEDAVATLKGHLGGPPSHLTMARAQYQAGDHEGAIETLTPFAELILQHSPDEADPRWPMAAEAALDYGRWLLAAGRAGAAVPYFRVVTQVRPGDQDAWQGLGQALTATGERDAGQKALAKSQELAKQGGDASRQVPERVADPTGAEVERARELLGEGKARDALQLLHSEIVLAPRDVRPRLLASRTLLLLGRAQEALQAAQQALDLEPANPDALYQRGTVEMSLKDLDAAEADLRQALKLAPDHLPAMDDLAVLLMVEGKRDEARELLRKVLEIRPDDSQAKANLAKLEAKNPS